MISSHFFYLLDLPLEIKSYVVISFPCEPGEVAPLCGSQERD